jgi:hypothetical protein
MINTTIEALKNNTDSEKYDLLEEEFGTDGDISRISTEDIELSDLDVLSKIYKTSGNCYVVATKNFHTGACEINFEINIDDAEKVATDKLLEVA